MNSFFSRWFSKTKTIKDPVFGKLHYSKDKNEWIGKISELLPGEQPSSLPGEPRTNISIQGDLVANLNWAHDKLSILKSRWLEINPSIIDAIYESYLEYEKNPTLRYNFPDRDRFKELIWIDCLRIFREKDNLEVNQDLPDYEVDFWSPRCGSFGGILRIQIKNWLPHGVIILPEDNPYPSKRIRRHRNGFYRYQFVRTN